MEPKLGVGETNGWNCNINCNIRSAKAMNTSWQKVKSLSVSGLRIGIKISAVQTDREITAIDPLPLSEGYFISY